MKKLPFLKAAAVFAACVALLLGAQFWFANSGNAPADHPDATPPASPANQQDVSRPMAMVTRKASSPGELPWIDPVAEPGSGTSNPATAQKAEAKAQYSDNWQQTVNALGAGRRIATRISVTAPASRRAGAPYSPPPVSAPAIVISGDGQGAPDLELPAGTRLPAILLDLDQRSDALVTKADAIVRDFVDRISKAVAADPSTAAAAVEAARNDADDQYRAAFGVEAYLIHSAEAGKKALKERQP
jgi:hypothetical protein